jgi:hypothetical protein
VQVFRLSDGAYQDQFAVSWASYPALGGDGRLYVTTCSWPANVEVYDATPPYTQRASFGAYGTGDGQFQGADGIAVQSGIAYVVDNSWYVGANRIEKWTTAGQFLGWIGKYAAYAATNGWHVGDRSEQGSLHGMLPRISGLAIDEQRDRLYATGYYEDTVQVFSLSSGAFLSRFSLVSFMWPNAMSVDSDNNVIVGGDAGFHLYDGTSYSLTFSFGAAGNDDGQFRGIFGLAISGYDLLVSDVGNNRIQKW